MRTHAQRSDPSKIWFDAEVRENPVLGTFTVPATSFWLHGIEYPLPAYSPDVGTAPFRLYIEKIEPGADYLLDLTGKAVAVSFGDGIGTPLVVWRDEPEGEIQVLRSVLNAA